MAANQSDAELIQGLLREEDIPSMTKKPSGSFLDDPFVLGPRQVLVPASAAEKAKKILGDLEVTGPLPGE